MSALRYMTMRCNDLGCLSSLLDLSLLHFPPGGDQSGRYMTTHYDSILFVPEWDVVCNKTIEEAAAMLKDGFAANGCAGYNARIGDSAVSLLFTTVNGPIGRSELHDLDPRCECEFFEKHLYPNSDWLPDPSVDFKLVEALILPNRSLLRSVEWRYRDW